MKKLLITIFMLHSVITHAANSAKDVNNSNNSSGGSFVYVFQHDSLKSTLSKFAKNTGRNINFSDLDNATLNQVVTGQFSVKNEIDILNILSERYGFRWFTYSGTLYITSTQQITKSIDVASDDMATIKNSLQQIGLLNDKFGYSQSNGSVVITGPATYVNMIINQIKNLDIAPVNQQFGVFRLKYANASDITLNINGQTVVVPGVATILQNLVQSRTTKNRRNDSPLLSKVAQPLTNDQKDSNSNSSNADNTSNNSSDSGSVSAPFIQADQHLNTVIIRDKKANLAIYKNLIETLDVPAPLIQVDVLIVRINNSKLSQEGINWWASNGNIGVGYGASGLSTTSPGNDLTAIFGQVSSGQLLLNSSNTFLASLNYLQQKEVAEAVSRPAVVTTDNIPAIISTSDDFYVNTASTGSNTTSYGQVTVNTSLQVTPHVIFDKKGKKQIKLSISLQDGDVNTQLINQMPETLQSALNSQAVISEGQSLLLAGYTKNKKVEVTRKIPLLGDIPLLGWFFKSNSTEQQKFTTLYLVSPKIVWSGNEYDIKDTIKVDDNKLNTNSYEKALSQNSKSKN